ncbi:pyruvate kinase [Dysosmobacter sp.]|uniref:pyruvate kinase n=1 Tax=Dysosmobacter sp. TaxID=2591382 RepID=UPI002A897D6F|nr:pyruvate kinase [Dysosmobacter sp.]MDY3282467.1 pyruvate kinase [Dysosmobacter sp.]
MNHTKIMGTIGPASSDPKIIEELILAGISSCRINFSHATYDQAEEIIRNIRQISRRLNRPVAIRQDLQGPKIRIGELEEDSYALPLGHEIVFTREEIVGDARRATIAQPEFIEAMEAGSEIIIGDNDLQLVVEEKLNPDEIRCRVTIPGSIKPRKGACAPGTLIRFKGLTEKDIRDFEFGIAQNVDCVSMSFVQTADDLDRLKAIMEAHNVKIPILAKIEQRNALENLDAILANCDGVSAARGDLAVERPIEELHLIDKEIIRRANLAGKFVFTGSGILKSLMKTSWPTRAEVCDVSALVLDGIDAISFSDETAVGHDPVGCVKVLSNIIARTESAMLANCTGKPAAGFFRSVRPNFEVSNGDTPIIMMAENLEQVARVAKMHYTAPVIAAVQNTNLANFLAHYWGVSPIYCPENLSRADCLDLAHQEAVRIGILQESQPVIRL